MICDPSTNGRRPDGTFAPGNRCSRGNPLGGRIARLRAAMLRAVDERDVAEIIRQVITRAKDGDLAAAKLILAYCAGKPGRLLDDLARRHPAALLPRSTVRELIGAEEPQQLELFEPANAGDDRPGTSLE